MSTLSFYCIVNSVLLDAGEQVPPPVLRLPGLIDMPISLDAELTGE